MIMLLCWKVSVTLALQVCHLMTCGLREKYITLSCSGLFPVDLMSDFVATRCRMKRCEGLQEDFACIAVTIDIESFLKTR